MNVLNDRAVGIIEELVEMGVEQFFFWSRNNQVELKFKDASGDLQSISINIKEPSHV